MAKLGGLLGGIGLFLLGMHLITDGLKTAAGGALRNILENGTRTPLRGILSGASITAVVQSSSAVTVAIIGFVNAGLMTLAQATGVIYGSNVGTPSLAMKALSLELGRIGEISRRMCGRALEERKQDTKAQETDRNALDNLVNAVGEFAVLMRQNGMPEALSKLLPIAMRVSRNYTESAELAENVSQAVSRLEAIKGGELAEEIDAFHTKLNELVNMSNALAQDFSYEAGRRVMAEVLEIYGTLKNHLLTAGGEGALSVRSLVDTLDLISNLRRMGEEVEEGARYLSDLNVQLENQ